MSRGETLKSAPACLFGRFPTPGCRSVTGNGLGKPKPKRTIMTIEKAILPPPPDRARSIPISALTPEQIAALTDLKKLKQEAAAEVERLIAFLDMVDGYSLPEVEVDDDVEPSLGFQEAFPGRGCNSGDSCDDREVEDGEDEPSLGSLSSCYGGGDQTSWGRGGTNDLEDEHDGCEPHEDDEPNLCGISVDAAMAGPDLEADDSDDEPSIGFDERELDHADDPQGELVNEDGDGDPDLEPSLGFLECFTGSGRSGQAGGCTNDYEDDGSYVTKAARKRYKPLDRYNTNRDGMHVDTERGFGVASRRIRNLSDRQRAAVTSRLNRDEVLVR